MSNLISPSELSDYIHSGKRYTLLASIWEPGEKGSFSLFSSLHIPTAHLCETAQAMAGLPGSQFGRNPLPDPKNLQKWFNRWGIQEDRPVFVYDEGRGLLAGRAWWVLRWAGVKDVRILDGGFAKWRRDGYRTMSGPGNLAMASDVAVTPHSLPVSTIDDVREHKGLLIDTREASRFAGRRENLDLKAGHIPGAVNISERDLRNPDRTWKSKEEVRDICAAVGATEETMKNSIIYSGSGNHSATAIAIMEWAGLPIPSHYVGGWSLWSADPQNPVEREL